MQYLALFCFLFSQPLVAAKYVPIDIKPGLWQMNANVDALVDDILKNFPSAQRKMMKQMVKGSVKKYASQTKVCMTQEQINDPEAQMKSMAQKNADMKDCKNKVIKSSKSFYHGKVLCKDSSKNIEIKATVINNKQYKTAITMRALGNQKQTITGTGKWLSEGCTK